MAGERHPFRSYFKCDDGKDLKCCTLKIVNKFQLFKKKYFMFPLMIVFCNFISSSASDLICDIWFRLPQSTDNL